MIAPDKRKDASLSLAVPPGLRLHLAELVESGALGDHGRSTSDAIRAMLAQVVARMEAGEALADSPYERVPTKLGERISFRCDEAFSEQVKALWTSDRGGRGSRSLTAFWIELLGRAVALARAEELWARPRTAGGQEPEDHLGGRPTVPGGFQSPAGSRPGPPPFGLTVEQWEEARTRFFETAKASGATGPHPGLPERQVRLSRQATSSDPAVEAVLAGLVRAQRQAWALFDSRPMPRDRLRVEDPDLAFVEESMKLIGELLEPAKKRRR